MHSSADYLAGFLVVDSTLGTIGTIEDVQEMPTQDLLIVAGATGEVLIPLVDDFIVEFDDEERVLTMDLPYGLVDLDAADNGSAEDDA